MRSSVKRLAIASLALALCLAGAGAQPEQAQGPIFALAERLSRAGDYDAAITEYKRFLFFFPQASEAWHARERIASCYRGLGQWQEALDWYENARNAAPEAEDRIDIELSAAYTEMAEGSFAAAEFRALSLRAFSAGPALEGRDCLCLGLIYLLTDRAKEADAELSAYALFLPQGKKEAFLSALEDFRAAPRPSASKAELLSTFLPGSGQAYAGEALDGAHALLVNASSALLVGWCVATGDYPDALLAFGGIFQRYYLGNRSNAKTQATVKNARMERALADRLISILAEGSVPAAR